MNRAAVRILCVTAVIGGVMASARLLENWFMFWPSRSLEGSPSDIGLSFEDVTLEPAPGTRIHGWYVPHPQPRAMVVYCEGNGGNRSDRIGHLQMLHRLGCSILIMDYEGYADCDGTATEGHAYRDARAARGWAAAHSTAGKLPEVLYGESLGGGVAALMAREKAPSAMILDHTFSRMCDMADKVCFGLPVRYIFRNRFDSLENIHHYHGPLLIIHGTADPFIPFQQGERLFAAANEPKRFLELPGATHDLSNLLQVGGDRYRDGIGNFLDSAVGSYRESP